MCPTIERAGRPPIEVNASLTLMSDEMVIVECCSAEASRVSDYINKPGFFKFKEDNKGRIQFLIPCMKKIIPLKEIELEYKVTPTVG